MKRKNIFLLSFFIIMGCILLPLGAQTLGDVNSDSNIDILDALLIAQYYVGLNPAQFNPQVADVSCDNTIDIIDALRLAQYYVQIIPGPFDCSTGITHTLTVEVSGRDVTISSIDLPYIDPPNIAISETAQFVYDTGTSVNLYTISGTPPPVPQEGDPPIHYQVASFEGSESNDIIISMDSDKTVQVVYNTFTLYPPGGEPYPTGTPEPMGDSFYYYAGGNFCIIEPESGPVVSSSNIQENNTIQGYTGEGYIECTGLPADLSIWLESLSTDSYYEIRFRAWDAANQQWTFDGYTEPIRMKFSSMKAYINLEFSQVNYIIDRVIIFREGTPESEWQNLDFIESTYSFTGVEGQRQGVFIIR